MKPRPIFALIILLLAGCAYSPAPLAADPDTAALLAQATTNAYATYQAESAAYATATMSAVLAIQEGTRQAVSVQQTAVAQATAQSVGATQQAVAAVQTAAAEQEQTRQAVAFAVASSTAVAMSTVEAREDYLALEAGRAELQATRASLLLAAQRDRERAERGRWWGLFWLAAAVGFAGVGLYTLYSFAVRRVSEARIIRNTRTGEPIAYRLRDGTLEYLVEPEPLPALPAPADDYEPPAIVRVNGARRETLYQYDDDRALHWRDMHIVLTQDQLRQLRRWHDEGHVRLRRDSSSAGPGVDKIGLGSGSVYNMLRAVLLGLEYIDESGAWTPRGVIELLQTSPFPASSTTVRPSSSSPSSWSDGDGAAGEAGWGSG